MRNGIKRILTFLLTLSIVFGLMATTVAYASSDTVGRKNNSYQSAGDSTVGSVGGSAITGWCDIVYDANGVTVTLTPSKEQILGITKGELQNILQTLIDAAKVVLIDELKDQILGATGPDLEDSGNSEGVTVDNLWTTALDGYLKNSGKYDEGDYVQFLKDAVEDDSNALIGDFIDYACSLIESALAVGVVKVEDLPDADSIGGKITEVFNDKVNEYVSDVVDDYVAEYLDWLINDAPITMDASIKEFIDEEVTEYIQSALDAYMNSGFEAPANPSELESAIADYLNDEIKNAVDTYIKNYAHNHKDENPAKVNELIDDEIDLWVGEILDNWGSGNVDNPIYNTAKDKIDEEILAKLNGYVDAYFTNGELPADVKAEIDREITERAPAYMSEYYWDNWKNTSGSHPAWFYELDEAIKNSAIDKILEEHPEYAGNEQKILDELNSFDRADIESRVDLEKEIATVIASGNPTEWKDVWDDIDVSERNAIIDSIKETIANSDTSKDIIKDMWADEATRVDAILDVVNNDSVYSSMLDELITHAKSDEAYKQIIVDEINSRTGNVIDTFREVLVDIKNDDSAKYEEIVEKITAEVQAEAETPEFREKAYEVYFGLTEKEVSARVETFVELLIVDYTELVERASVETPSITPEFILEKLYTVSINGNAVYDDKTISFAALRALLGELPLPDELKNMENKDMRLDYYVEIVTEFGKCDFNVALVLGAGYDAVRKLASFVSQYFDLYLDNGTLQFNVRVPEKFANLLVRACNTAKLPDYLKEKVFAVISGSPDDAYALFNSLTFEEIMAVLEHIDFERVLDSKYLAKFEIEELTGYTRAELIEKLCQYEDLDDLIDLTRAQILDRLSKYEMLDKLVELTDKQLLERLSNYERLDNLVKFTNEEILQKLKAYGDVDITAITNEQILAKVREYQYLYNKLVDYIQYAYESFFPDRIKDNSIGDLYNGNGNFDIGASYTLDVEKLLTKFSEKYGALIASYIDVYEIPLSFNVDVTFENINKVEYYIGNTLVRDGFLPAGANVDVFSGVTLANGYKIVAWVDAEGNVYEKMPDADVQLYAVTDRAVAIIDGGVDKVYDGKESELKVHVEYDFTNPEFTYQWYFNGVAIEGATNDTLTVKNVRDSGIYYCVVTVVDGDINDTLESNAVTVSITPCEADLSEIEWDYTQPFKYNGQEQTVLVSKLPSYLAIVEGTYVGNTATVVGKYTAYVTVEVIDENYKLPAEGGVVKCEWEIDYGILDLGKLEWNYDEPFQYTGEEFTVEIENVGNVTFFYEGNVATNAGTYTAKVVRYELHDNNYSSIKGGVEDIPTLTWRILPAEFDLTKVKFEDAESVYTGLKQSIAISGAEFLPLGTEVSYSDVDAINVGEYTFTATITNPNYETVTLTAKLTIIPKDIDLSQYSWNYENAFTFNGSEFTVTLEGCDFDLVYVDNSKTNAGEYKAVATLADKYLNNPNYNVINGRSELTWKINLAKFNLSGFVFNDATVVYDGNPHKLNYSGANTLPSGTVVTVTGDAQTNVGVYTFTATISNPNYEEVTITKTLTITKANLDFSEYSWNYTSEFIYNGTEFEVYIVDGEGNKSLIFTYEGTNKATNAGTYSVRAILSADIAANYNITGMIADEIEWTIAPAQFTGITFEDVTVSYDGNPHSIEVSGTLPEGTVVTYSPESATEVGEYLITATLTNPNYVTKTLTATLTITKSDVPGPGPGPGTDYKNQFTFVDKDGNVLVGITTPDGLPADHMLNVKDVTLQYQSFTFPENFFGESLIGKVIGAYDIHFVVEGTVNPVTGEFEVKLLIPSNARGEDRTLKVVHIDDNGNAEIIESTREGDYLVFTTSHFSVYAIVDVTEAPAPASTFPWWIFIIIAVVLIAALVVVLLVLKKKKAEAVVAEDVETVEGEVSEGEVTPEEPETTEEEAPAEAPAEEPVEAPAEAPAEDSGEMPAIRPDIIVTGDVEIPVRYRHSFMSRLIQSEPPIQDYYTTVKNTLLSYKGVKARTSWNFESFNKGREQCAKLNVKGKNFLVYLNLNPSEYNVNKYHFQDVTDKPKVGDVPMLLKVKSDRGLKYAIELIDEMMSKFGYERTEEMPNVDYHMPYESTQELAKRDLVKVILPKGVMLDENFNIIKLDVGELVEAGKKAADGTLIAKVTETSEIKPLEVIIKEVAEEHIHIDVTNADELVTDEQAKETIVVVAKDARDTAKGNKMGEINVDTLSENFESGDTVTLKELKAKKLVPSNIGRVKVLARGEIDKNLTVVADKFSIQAVKMIKLAGGDVQQCE